MIGFASGRITSWPGVSLALCDFLEETSPGSGRTILQQTGFLKALAEQPHAAGVIHIRRGESAAWFQISEHGSLRRNFVELVELQGHACVAARSRAGAARRSSSRRWLRRTRSHSASDACVMIWLGRRSLRKKLHHGFAAIDRDLLLSRINGRNFVCAHGRNSEKRNRGRHRVRSELAAARACAGTRVVFEVGHLLRGHFSGRECAGRFEHVLNRDVVPLKSSGHDRAAVERQAGKIQPRESHHRAGNRLIATADRHDRVERVRAHEKLDRIGDHLARNQRSLHAFGAHRDSVGNHDGVAFDRRATRGANAFFHLLRERAQMEIAGRDFAPRVGHGDQRPREVGVGKTGRLQHRARRRSCNSFFDGVTLHFW